MKEASKGAKKNVKILSAEEKAALMAQMANETPEEKKERKKKEAEEKALEKKRKIEEGKIKKAQIAAQLAE